MPPLVPPPRGAAGRSLVQAVASAVVLLALVAAAYAAGASGLFALVVVVVGLALFELLAALRAHGRRPVVTFGLGLAAAIVAASYAGRPSLVLACGAVLVIGSLTLALRPGRGATPASDAAWTILGVTWIGGAGAAAVAVLRLSPAGPSLLIAYLLVVAAADIGAYFTGARLGRHKLAPDISPGKSWEGVAGGMAAALAGGAAAGALLAELTWLQGIGMGLLCGAFGPVGDLVESLVKREIGIKDSGGLLPGHGGFLDRLDAMIFCAPLVLIYLRALGL